MSPSTRRRGLLQLAPAIVLVLVAATQWIAAETVPVSPWIGGGFGMFATVDGDDRVVTTGDGVIRSAVATDHAAAPFATTARQLLEESGDGGTVRVWAPTYRPGSGRVEFVPIASHSRP